MLTKYQCFPLAIFRKNSKIGRRDLIGTVEEIVQVFLTLHHPHITISCLVISSVVIAF
jgi:hypothetical protein